MKQNMTEQILSDDPRGPALGFAQRRSWVFSAWWYPAVLCLSGAAHWALSLLSGADPELGLVLFIMGTVLTALGWAATVKPRFTRKPPKPPADIPRVDQGIRITPGMIWTIPGGTAVVVLLLALLTPWGRLLKQSPCWACSPHSAGA